MRIILKTIILCISLVILFFIVPLLPVVTSYSAQSVAMDSNNKIIVGGVAIDDDVNNFFAARYSADGVLDTTFNTVGYRNDLIGTASAATSVAIHGGATYTDRAVVAGNAMVSGVSNLAVARYTTAGALDTSWGGAGTVTTAVTGSSGSTINGMQIQSDDYIVVAGGTIINGTSQIVAARYTPTGSLDEANFNPTNEQPGLVVTQVGVRASAQALVIQSDAKITLTGYAATTTASESLILLRYNSNGTLDTGFGTGGITTPFLPTGFRSCQGNAIIELAGGSLIVAGTATSDEGKDYMVFAGYSSAGVLLASVTYTYADGVQGTSVGVQSDGKYMVGGITQVGNNYEAIIFRLTTGGALDTTYNSVGYVTTNFADKTGAQGLIVRTDTGPPTHADHTLITGFKNLAVFLSCWDTTGSIDQNFGMVSVPNAETFQDVVAYLSDQKTSGTAGGTFTAGAWQTRTLNTSAGDTSFVSLSSNQFTLQPGIYNMLITAPGYACSGHMIRLRNITASSDVAYGTSAFAGTGAAIFLSFSSIVLRRLIIDNPTTYEVQHWCTLTRATDGFGYPATITATSEIYTSVAIEKLQ